MRVVLAALLVAVGALNADAQSQLFVSASGPSGTLTGAIDLPSGRVVWVVPSPKPSKLVTTADGRFLVVPTDDALLLVDLTTFAITPIAEGVKVDGSTLIAHPRRTEFFAWLTDGTLAAITQSAVRKVFSCVDGKGPTISADGLRVIVTCGQDIVALDPDSGSVITRFATGRTIDFPVTNQDGSRVVVREWFAQGGPRSDLALYEIATGTRLVERISPRLSTLDPGVLSILAVTPARDALLAVDAWSWFGSCARSYYERIIDFDTLAIRQTLSTEGDFTISPDRGLTGAFTGEGTLAIVGWQHAVSTCGFYDAGVTLFDRSNGASVRTFDLTSFVSSSGGALTLATANAPLPPGTPAAIVDATGVTLSWSEPPIASAATTRYVIEAGSAPGCSHFAVSVDGGQTSFRVNNVPAGRYYVRVRAANFTGTSNPSPEISVTVR
jgi:hypothetical protein